MIDPPTHSKLNIQQLLDAYPDLPVRVRLMDRFVSSFPRRFFVWASPARQEKIISHVLFFSKELTPVQERPCAGRYEIKLADKGAAEKIATHSEALPKNVYMRRLEAGDQCYCLSVDGDIKSYQWVSYETCHIYCGFESEICFRELKAGEVYTYDFYTYNDSRGKGYGGALKRHVWNDLLNRQTMRVFSAIHHDNFVSLGVHLKAGFELVNSVYLYRLMRWTGVIWGSRYEAEQLSGWIESLGLRELR